MTAIDFTQLLRDAKRKSNRLETKTFKPIVDGKKIEVVEHPLPTLATPNAYWKDQYNGSLAFEKLNLQQVCSNPKSIFYSPDCLADSRPLTQWLVSALPQGDSGFGNWKTMTYGKRKVCMLGEVSSLPPPFTIIAEQLVQAGIFPSNQPPNHVLLNEYQPSQGILPHTDGPLYASRTATLSLGSDVVLEFSKRLATDEIGATAATAAAAFSILLHANSLIVFEDDAYLNYCHGIAPDVWEDTTGTNCLNASPGIVVLRGHRYSLTFRHRLPQSDSSTS